MQTQTHQPLHRKIVLALRQQILDELHPGDRLDSQNEIAKKYRVSVMTAREALSALVEEGLIERRQGSGTYVSSRGAKRAAAVLMELDIAHPRTSIFYRRVVQQLRVALRKRNMSPRLYLGELAPDQPWNGELTCEDFVEDLRAHRIGGVAAVALDPSKAWFKSVEAAGVPVVGGTSAFKHRVVIDLQRIMRLGLDHLIALGRRNIACIGWGEPEPILAAIQAAGGQTRPEWIRAGIHPAMVGAGWKAFRALWSAPGPKPDALIVTDDILFSDVRSALLELRVNVPSELLVVTHANRGANYPAPFPVAKIEVDPDAYADAMGQILSDLMERRPRVPEEMLSPLRLVTEDTSELLEAWREPAGTQHGS
ncbi:MAG: GntR family transcriptional regulator [Planctomycetota bacterium]|nr:GntR family transcriptional regulator [Planctomycetota bacterium]